MAENPNPVNLPLSLPGELNSVPRQESYIDIANRLIADGHPNLATGFPMLNIKDVDFGGRYPIVFPGMNNEEMYANAQSAGSRWWNSLVKMGATAGGVFLQGFGTIPDTVKAIKNGDINALTNPTGWEAKIDEWRDNLENKFPNYYSEYEKEHPFLSMIPFAKGSANFWGDKFLKNLGFTIGAIGSAVAQDAIVGAITGGLGEIPMIGSQIAKASLWMNKLFAGSNDVNKLLKAGRVGDDIINMGKLRTLANINKVKDGARYAVGLYGSARTEAAIEAREGYRSVKESLINLYKAENFGLEPSGRDLKEIEDFATDAMNVRFGINMALLVPSNALQFDMILKPFGSVIRGAEKGLTGSVVRDIEKAGKIGLKEGSIDTFEAIVPKTVKGKVWEAVKPKLPVMFSEGVWEEGGQYAAERGTYDYYTRKYKDPSKGENRETWNTLSEISSSTLQGLAEQFGSSEGIQNMILGALTGLFAGTVMDRVDIAKGGGKQARLQSTINTLNNTGVTSILKDQYEGTINKLGILKEMQEAIKTGDIFKYKNLQQDTLFQMVAERARMNLHDVTIEQLEMLKDLDQEEFEKTFGIDLTQENKATVSEYIDSVINKANQIKKNIDIVDKAFINPFRAYKDPKSDDQKTENGNHNTFNNWKTDLAYYASIKDSVENRLSSINESLMKINPLLNLDNVSFLWNTEEMKELSASYEEQAAALEKTIDSLPTFKDKRETKNRMKALRTLSERINLILKGEDVSPELYHQVLNYELNNHNADADEVVSIDQIPDIANYSLDINRLRNKKKRAAEIYSTMTTKEGFDKYFNQAEEIRNKPVEEEEEEKEYGFENAVKENETPEIGREYEVPNLKVARVRKISDGRFRVMSPDNVATFYSTKEEAKEYADYLNEDIADLAKITVLELNPDGTIKIEDLSGNIQNINPSLLTGYMKVMSPEEKLLKDKEQIKKAQEQSELDSGDAPTGNPTNEERSDEPKLKEASIYFKSSISESESLHNVSESAAHVKRGRVFLNNAHKFKNRSKLGAILVTSKNEEELGLKGLTQLSFEVSEDVANSDKFKQEVNDVNNGFIAQVFIEHDKGKNYFVDETGKRLTEVGKKADLDKVVFQTMPTNASHSTGFDKGGKPYSLLRYRADQKDLFMQYLDSWTKEREKILSSEKWDGIVYKFNISRGIPRENIVNGQREKNHVGGILVDENLIPKTEGLIQLPTNGTVSFKGENIKFPDGRPVLVYGDSLVFLNNTTFDNEKSTSIFHAIHFLANDIIKQSEAGETIVPTPRYMTYLQNVLFYSSKTKYNSANKAFINTDNMTFSLGSKSYPLSKIAENEKEIIAQLKETFHSVNNKSLKGDKFSKPFYELVYDKDSNSLKDRKWDNYQTYLLASKSPEGSRSAESTPLNTSIAKPTIEQPYPFIGKYSTLIEFELPIQKPAPKQPAPPSAEGKGKKVGDFTANDESINTMDTKIGKIDFKLYEDEKGFLSAIVIPTEVTEGLAEKGWLGEQKVPEQIQKTFTDNMSEEDKILMYLSYLILPKVKATIKKEAPKQETPKEEKKEEPKEDKGGFNINNFKKPTGLAKRIGKTDSARLTPQDIEIAKEWIKENLPQFPIEVLENIIRLNPDENAFGVFEDNVIKFYKKAVKGTPYHEAFEAVWNSFLSPEEQVKLMDEFKSNKGTFLDETSGKRIDYSNATDEQIKERIADDFHPFLRGRLPARSLGQWIVKLYRRVIEFFKSFGRKQKLKIELFNKINEGKFKETPIPLSTVEAAPQYKKIPGIPETIAYEFVQDFTVRAAIQIFGSDKSSLYQIKKIEGENITGDSIKNKIKEQLTDEGKYQEIERVGEGNFDKLWKRTKENLRTIGINFNEEDVVDINDEDTNNRDYAPEAFSTDWRKYAPYAIKFTCATSPQMEPMNQENKESLDLPEPKWSRLNGFLPNAFNRMFVTLMDKLSNTSSPKKLEEKMLKLAQKDSNYVLFFQRVGGNLATGTFNFSEFEYEDWRLFIEFAQTFTKQYPTANIQYVNDNEVWTAPANSFVATKELQRNWFENMKTLARADDTWLKYNSTTKTYDVIQSKLPDKSPKGRDKMLDFLNHIGVNITRSTYMSLSQEQKDRFAKAVGDIYAHINKAEAIGSIRGRTLGINGPLSIIANLIVDATHPNRANTYPGVDGEMHQSYTENNVPSVFENEFNEAETIEELKNTRSELNDVFSTNSIVLKKGGQFIDEDGNIIKEIKVSYIQGQKDNDANKGLTTKKLSLGDRFAMEINQNINGNYYILIPADSSTEWMINLGNHISFSDIREDRAWQQILDIFTGYLKDDIALAKDFENRQHLVNVKEKAKQLRFFSDILSAKDLSAINKLIETGATDRKINNYIEKNKESINEAVQNYILSVVNGTRSILAQNKYIVANSEGNFIYRRLDSNFVNSETLDKFNLTDKQINEILLFTGVNDIINKIELHKILFGDPLQFKVKNEKLDETKRIKSFLSPARTTFDSPEYNASHNNKYNTVGDIQLESSDLGYNEHRSFVRTATLSDVNLSTLNFPNVNEADGFSIMTDKTYRDLKQRNHQWTPEAEDWFQWNMAYTRLAAEKKKMYKYSNNKLKAHDLELTKEPEPIYHTEVIKPIIRGNKNGMNRIELDLGKTAMMPIQYKAVEDKSLGDIYLRMMINDYNYLIFESGRKVGIDQMHSLYNEDGTLNTSPFNNLTEVPWKNVSIQVENIYKDENDQTRGSQAMKISSLDLFDNGAPNTSDPDRAAIIREKYDKYNKTVSDLHETAYKTLLSNLGIEDNGNGHYTLLSPATVSEALKYEMFRRQLSENSKDTIELDENGEFSIPFEASTSYLKIRDILYSMVHKAIVSPKMSGGSHVQVPVTLWENSKEGRRLVIKTDDGYKHISREEYSKLSPEDKGKVRLTSDTLKFYTKEEPYCEVMLPHWFKERFDSKKFKNDEALINYLNNHPDGKRILTGIGFRIPTQAMSSMEVFRVKGFLPQSMGTTVVVPSEITAKAGSDFDIDKLNTYLKSIYIDDKGDIQLTTLKGTEQETKEFYKNIYKEQKFNELESVSNKTAFKYNILIILNKFETVDENDKHKASTIFPSLTEEEKDFYYKYQKTFFNIMSQSEELDMLPSEYIQSQLDRLGNKSDKLFVKLVIEDFADDYANLMYKKALENEFYEAMEGLLTLPENFERMMSPVSDGGLAKESSTLDTLRGYDETKTKNRILDRNYITSLRHSFLLGTKWRGVAVVNSVSHAIAQKTQITIDPQKIKALKQFDRELIGDGKIILPHNTTTIEGEDRITMSSVKTADGKEYISDRLSGYITATVDIANDPYIIKILNSDAALSTALFLERIGVGVNTVYFINQPIIRNYLEYIENAESKSVYNKKNLDYIKSQFPAKVQDIDNATIDVKKLKDNISDYYTKNEYSSAYNAVQHLILDEFLKYSRMAQFSFKFYQAHNYDTSKFRNSDTFSLKQTKTRIAEEYNIFSSVEDLLSNTFIGKQRDILNNAMDSMGAILKLEQDEFKHIVREVMREYEERDFMAKDDFQRVAMKAGASFLDYIIQIKGGFNTEINKLFVSGDSVARQLERAREKYPQLQLLRDLEIRSSDTIEGPSTVILGVNVREAYDENHYTDMMRELKEIDTALYDNLIKLAILQGTYQTAYSIRNIIPVEDYSAKIKPIIESLVADPEINAFSKGMFQRNNWKDDAIFSPYKPKFWQNENVAEMEDYYGNSIYYYYSPQFESIKGLKLDAKDRSILFLSPKYNAMDIDKDFLKVPRIVVADGLNIDMRTGRTIPSKTLSVWRAKGNTSLRETYGYQKVKYPDGSPLIDNQGRHVYKLINLWGDGDLVKEYYTGFQPSVLVNNTVKMEKEFSDEELINFFSPREAQPAQKVNQPIDYRGGIPEETKSTVKSIQKSSKESWMKNYIKSRFGSEAENITLSYPKEILLSDEMNKDVVQTSKLVEAMDIFDDIDDGTIDDTRKFKSEWLEGYGMTDKQYEFAKKNEKVLENVVFYSGMEDLDRTTFREMIEPILRANETINNKRQLTLDLGLNTNFTQEDFKC